MWAMAARPGSPSMHSIIVLGRRFLHHDLALPPDRDVFQCAYRLLLWAMAQLDMPPGHS